VAVWLAVEGFMLMMRPRGLRLGKRQFLSIILILRLMA